MIRIQIKTENAAFADNPAHEVARILRRVAVVLEEAEDCGDAQGCNGMGLRDINGNTVGTLEIPTGNF